MVSVWKGAINFGLLNVPVKLSVATSKEDISFRNLHKECNSPLNQKRWCSKCNKEVDYKDIVKGYEYQKGKFVILEPEEFKDLPVKSTRYISLMDFIALEEVDPIYFEKTYYLTPESNGEKPYIILYEAMKKSGKVALGKITIREKEHLCLIRCYQDFLVLNTMYFANEIRSSKEIDMKSIAKKNQVSDIEMKMAVQIVENLTEKFDIEKYHDEYREELLKIINAKIHGEEIIISQISYNESGLTDLLEKLKASVEATKSSNPRKKTAQNAKRTDKTKKENAG